MHRSHLPFVVFVACLLTVPCAASSDMQLVPVVGGFDQPVAVDAPAGDADRLFVAEQRGAVKLVLDGVLQPTPFLDLRTQVFAQPLAGMLNVVVHPDYANNGYVYVYFSTGPSTARLSRFTRSAGNPDVADPSSELVLLEVTNPVEFHQGGGLAFGPDGKLYLGVGDQREISGGTCTAQEGDVLVGKLLRLEDDGSVPADNPFVGDPTVRDEIYAFGLRMPFRIDFDALSGDLMIFDVGEASAEELDVIPLGAAAGANFGWRPVEGSECTGAPSCSGLPCPDPAFVEPTMVFPHTLGRCCIIGGTAYHGTAVQSLLGQVVYADWCTGGVWSAEIVAGRVVNVFDRTFELSPPGQSSLRAPTSIESVGDELYVVDGGPNPGEGVIYRLVGVDSPFVNLGHGLEGIFGTPSLTGSGTLLGGTTLTLRLSSADVSTLTTLVIGFAVIDAAFKGGVLLPSPDLIVPGIPVTDLGISTLVFVWPTGVPSGVSVYFQHWVQDSAALIGYSASNGLSATTP